MFSQVQKPNSFSILPPSQTEPTCSKHSFPVPTLLNQSQKRDRYRRVCSRAQVMGSYLGSSAQACLCLTSSVWLKLSLPLTPLWSSEQEQPTLPSTIYLLNTWSLVYSELLFQNTYSSSQTLSQEVDITSAMLNFMENLFFLPNKNKCAYF